MHVTGNAASGTVGEVRVDTAAVSWLGSASTRSGITDNTASAVDNLQLSASEFSADALDFGEPGTHSFPADITLPDSGSAYAAQDGAAFTCGSERCGQSREHDLGRTASSPQGVGHDIVFGNVFEAALEHTLDGFEVELSAPACEVGILVLEAATLDTDWTVAGWSGAADTISGGSRCRSSGPIGRVTEPGRFYALATLGACSIRDDGVWTEVSLEGPSPLDGGFGTSVGWMVDCPPATIQVGHAHDLDTSTGTDGRFDSMVTTTEL